MQLFVLSEFYNKEIIETRNESINMNDNVVTEYLVYTRV